MDQSFVFTETTWLTRTKNFKTKRNMLTAQMLNDLDLLADRKQRQHYKGWVGFVLKNRTCIASTVSEKSLPPNLICI